MNKHFITFFISLCGVFSQVQGQVYNYADGEGPVSPDSVKGFYFGLNLGVYFANNKTANFYDGFGYSRDGGKLGFTNSWLNLAIQGSPQAQDRTSDALGGITADEWRFDESDMPLQMTFGGSFLYGAHVRYMFNSDFGLFSEIYGTNPVTTGQFTIQKQTGNPLGNDNLESFGIRGEEQRLLITLGIHRVLGRKAATARGKTPSILPYFDLGFNATFSKFEANFINLGDLAGNVDLTVFFNNQGQFTDAANVLTGAGVGGFAALGMQITIGRKFTIDLGYVASFEQINLGELNQRALQSQIVLKAIYM